ncbi:hypothetical protein NQZ68_019852 [Dissostichus eleginoides]|nr:hypothetical protein NQZ68_019852 [Dissostichus eleginoides]
MVSVQLLSTGGQCFTFAGGSRQSTLPQFDHNLSPKPLPDVVDFFGSKGRKEAVYSVESPGRGAGMCHWAGGGSAALCVTGADQCVC